MEILRLAESQSPFYLVFCKTLKMDYRRCSGTCVDGTHCGQTYMTQRVEDRYYCYHHVGTPLRLKFLELQQQRHAQVLQREKARLAFEWKQRQEREQEAQKARLRFEAQFRPNPFWTIDQWNAWYVW